MSIPTQLRSMLEAIAPLAPGTWDALDALFAPRELGKRALLVAPGSVATRVGLLEAGVVRAFYPTESGSEYNKHLFLAPAVVGDYASLLTGAPARVGQQTLTSCRVWLADFRALLALEARHPDLALLPRRFAESMYLLNEARELEMATLTAGERYVLLRERTPEIEEMVPQYEIASYLGVTPTQLSRIRGGFST